MSYTKQEIIQDITVHITGAPYEDCYVGVICDIEICFVTRSSYYKGSLLVSQSRSANTRA